MKKNILLTVLFSLFFVSSLQAYFVNKDLTNKGPVADDIAVILSGSEVISSHYDGYSNGRFSSFSWGPDGPNTKLHWQNFKDNDNNRIDNGQTIHVGWNTSDQSNKVLDMYWTDPKGNRIEGSIVHNITSGWTYETTSNTITLDWENIWDDEVIIYNVNWAVITEPIALDLLNYENDFLQEVLRPIEDGEQIIISPGDVATRTITSDAISADSYIVLRYDVISDTSQAYSTDFIQFRPMEDDRNFYISTEEQWKIALEKGQIKPLEEDIWAQYIEEWNNNDNTIINGPFPETTFIPADLYTWDGTYMDFTLYPGLVMSWGDESILDEGEPYASAWTFRNGNSMDLTGAKNSIIVFPPQGIENISIGLIDINGNFRAWYWNTGDELPNNTDTQLVITPNLESGDNIAATVPQAVAYMTNREFDITQVESIIIIENGVWRSNSQLFPPGFNIRRIWNYWREFITNIDPIIVTTNVPPAVSITSPSNNTEYNVDSDITITATASDSDGSVTRVEFYANGSKIGEDSTIPYSITMPEASIGTYVLTAVATDNEGASTTSRAVTISVIDNTIDYEEITAPFTHNGIGEFYWKTTDIPGYINSWNLKLLEINGVDVTNTWISSYQLPAKQGGYYYIHYIGLYAWCHFEFN